MCDDLFEIENNVLVKVRCPIVDLTIPHIYKGKQIDSIGCGIFSHRVRDPYTDDIEDIGEESLKSIRISHGIKSIQANAFRNCQNLRSVYIPYTLETIGKNAFRGCSSLQYVLLNQDHISIFDENPDRTEHLRMIDDQAFYNCRSLKFPMVNIKSGMDYIGNEAFAYCESLKEALLPYCRNGFGYGIYKHCASLQSCFVSYNCNHIPNQTFAFCYELRYINPTDKEKVVLPLSVESIGAYAFTCTSFQEIEFPNTCKTIDKFAFYNCLDLRHVTFSSYTIVREHVFDNGGIDIYSLEVNEDTCGLNPLLSINRISD